MLRGKLHILIIVFAVALSGAAQAAPVVFDKPLRTQSGEQTPKPDRRPLLLTCLYYPHFTLIRRRYDNREVGDYSVGPAGAPTSGCVEPGRGSFVSLMFGRLTGVKGNYVFLEDRFSAEYPESFGVFDGRTGLALIQDKMFGAWSAIRFAADGFALRYRRAYSSDCALLYGIATECWTAIKRATGLTDAMAPDCHAAYQQTKREYAGDMKYVMGTSASITYNVEARYGGGRLTYRAIPGDVTCSTRYRY